jgi:hypothetical protein
MKESPKAPLTWEDLDNVTMIAAAMIPNPKWNLPDAAINVYAELKAALGVRSDETFKQIKQQLEEQRNAVNQKG